MVFSFFYLLLSRPKDLLHALTTLVYLCESLLSIHLEEVIMWLLLTFPMTAWEGEVKENYLAVQKVLQLSGNHNQ